MRTRYKAWAKPFLIENNSFCAVEENIDDSKELAEFLKADKLCLEIGSGKGMFVMSMAEKYPEYNFLCIEKSITIAGISAKLIKEKELKNIFLIAGDVSYIFEKLPKKSVDFIFLNHPDPWPKARHEKRRLTSDSFLKMYETLLKDNAYLILKTDNDDMFKFSIESLEEQNWTIFEKEFDYKDTDTFDALTNYEINFQSKNVPIKRLKAKK